MGKPRGEGKGLGVQGTHGGHAGVGARQVALGRLYEEVVFELRLEGGSGSPQYLGKKNRQREQRETGGCQAQCGIAGGISRPPSLRGRPALLQYTCSSAPRGQAQALSLNLWKCR